MGSWSTVQLSDLEPGDLDPELLVSDSGFFESDLLVAPPLSDEAFFCSPQIGNR